MRHVDYFVDWIKINHPDVTTLKKARQYVKTWLEGRNFQYKIPQNIARIVKMFLK